jgi:hypothetical protein
MSRRAKIWFGIATIFALGNLAGAMFAAVIQHEFSHAGLHVGLMMLGFYAANRLWRRPTVDSPPAAIPEMDDRLSSLERSIDAVAVEIERVGEGQRYMTKRFAEAAPAEPATAVRDNADESLLIKARARDHRE